MYSIFKTKFCDQCLKLKFDKAHNLIYNRDVNNDMPKTVPKTRILRKRRKHNGNLENQDGSIFIIFLTMFTYH